MPKWIIAALALTFGLAAVPAFAMTYKNPAHGIEPGQFTLDLHIENFARGVEVENKSADAEISVVGVSFGFGVGETGALNLMLGNVSVSVDGHDGNGVEGGIMYRQDLDKGQSVDGAGGPFKEFLKGFFLSYRGGYVESNDGEVEYEQLDLGFGGATPAGEGASIYGGGVLSTLTGTVYVDATNDSFGMSSTRNVGIFAGVELRPQRRLALGGEIHFLHEIGFSLYLEYAPQSVPRAGTHD